MGFWSWIKENWKTIAAVAIVGATGGAALGAALVYFAPAAAATVLVPLGVKAAVDLGVGGAVAGVGVYAAAAGVGAVVGAGVGGVGAVAVQYLAEPQRPLLPAVNPAVNPVAEQLNRLTEAVAAQTEELVRLGNKVQALEGQAEANRVDVLGTVAHEGQAIRTAVAREGSENRVAIKEAQAAAVGIVEREGQANRKQAEANRVDVLRTVAQEGQANREAVRQEGEETRVAVKEVRYVVLDAVDREGNENRTAIKNSTAAIKEGLELAHKRMDNIASTVGDANQKLTGLSKKQDQYQGQNNQAFGELLRRRHSTGTMTQAIPAADHPNAASSSNSRAAMGLAKKA